MPDVSSILRLPNNKVNRWVKNYWDSKFGRKFDSRYSWSVRNIKAISFHTLVEFYTFIHLQEAGITIPKILKAHEELSEEFTTPFPFAIKNIINKIHSDGKKIYFEFDDKSIITLNGLKQFNLDFIRIFFKKLDFDVDDLASKLWPIGKEKSIVCDPLRRFGQPVIDGTNILAETIYDLYRAGEREEFISDIYNINVVQIRNAIEYCGKDSKNFH